MKKFKAHSQKVLELMINSIYTNKEIFLRELISNASDALDKAKFISLTDSELQGPFFVEISADKKNRVLSITDTGIGMDEKELEDNLGTIAESGTGRFKLENKAEEQFIGQFGVGFYSAFMVADKIEVVTKKQGGKAYKWTSDATGYDIEEAQRQDRGTTVSVYLKKPDEDTDYDMYLDSWQLQQLVKKYSDYIRYPIYMDMEKTVPKPDGGDSGKKAAKTDETGEESKWETVTERECLNSMVPIWKRGKDADKAELDAWYQKQYYQLQPPLEVIQSYVEGTVNYHALLFFPSEAPFDYFSPEYERGLSLYSSGVMIMENCKELLPDYLGFVKGVVDSEDLSLNISRETLQKNRQLSAISASIEKKALSAMSAMLQNEREKYEKLFAAFGSSLKIGIYNNFGAKKNELKDLLLYYSSTEKKPVTLKEYVARMGDNKEILYASASDAGAIENLPVMDMFKQNGREVLYFTDRIDEFVAKILDTYDGRLIRSVADKDVEVDGQAKEKAKKEAEENKELLAKIKECLKDRVTDVTLSVKLGAHPVFLNSSNSISLEMEKVLNSVNKDNKAVAQRVLELNPEHGVFNKLKEMIGEQSRLRDAAIILYNQALLLSGMTSENTAEFCAALNRLLTE